jgi:hypothetical protein
MPESSKQSPIADSSSEKFILLHSAGLALGGTAAPFVGDGRSRRTGERITLSLVGCKWGVDVAVC